MASHASRTGPGALRDAGSMAIGTGSVASMVRSTGGASAGLIHPGEAGGYAGGAAGGSAGGVGGTAAAAVSAVTSPLQRSIQMTVQQVRRSTVGNLLPQLCHSSATIVVAP